MVELKIESMAAAGPVVAEALPAVVEHTEHTVAVTADGARILTN